MSNRRKLAKVRIPASEAAVSLTMASLKVQALAAGKDSFVFNRRMKRSMRRSVPAELMNHQQDHDRQENCGRSCEPYWYKRITR